MAEGLDRQLWRATQDRVRAEKLEAPPAPIVASDIDVKYVAMAQKSALKARVEKYMTFATCRFQDSEPCAGSGLLVTNLPYGERSAASEGDVRQLYEEVGDTLKQKFSGWRPRSRGVGVAVQGDRAPAGPHDRSHERQHSVQAAAVRAVQPAAVALRLELVGRHQSGAHVVLDAVGCDRVADAVLCQCLHAPIATGRNRGAAP